MLTQYRIRRGYHEPMDFTLKHKVGSHYLPTNIAGYTRVILKRYSEKGLYDQIDEDTNPAELLILNAIGGSIRLLPTAAYWDIPPQDIKVVFDVVIGGRIYKYPTDCNDEIIIRVTEDY